MTTDCIFCKIVKGELPSYKIYEDDDVLAFLDIMPINPGHTLVIPKAHYADLFAMPEDQVSGVFSAAKKVAKAVIRGVGADAFNLGVNNGKTAGQVVFHAHIHIMPRFPDDGHKLWPGKKYGEGEAEKVREKIRASLK